MMLNRFTINEHDKCVYIKCTLSSFIIICLYVDDMLIMTSDHDITMTTKNMLTKNFDMKDMGITNIILGIDITKIIEGIVHGLIHLSFLGCQSFVYRM